MSGDQASGLRQWSQAHASARDVQASAVELVVMTWHDGDVDTLAQRLTRPEGISGWQPRPLVLSLSLPDHVPGSLWWMLHLTHLETRGASGLADALRRLHHVGMPSTLLLSAPERPWMPGLISAARTHLGVRLLQDVTAWHQAVMASSDAG